MAAMKNNIGKIGGAAMAARSNPYVQRLLEDRELRETLRGAYVTMRSAYGRMNNGQAPTKALFEDRKLQRELSEAARALRDVSTALREGPRRARREARARRRRARRRSLAALVIVGTGLALVLSKDLRSKVLDLMFGSEEEFDYSSTTTPPEPAPAPAASSTPSGTS
jgi:hypothetical protein